MKITYGNLISFCDRGGGSDLVIHIEEPIAKLLEQRRIKQLEIGFDDGRTISTTQRRKIYAMLRDISEYTGYDPESAKQFLKLEHMKRTGIDKLFSLSDCSVTVAREFINTLMDYALKEGIILTDMGLYRTDDIDTYLIQCIRYRKCCICGRGADIHHVDAIGMGNDRRHVDDSKKEIMALCRQHHQAAHNMGNTRFMSMYKVYGIVKERAEAYGTCGKVDIGLCGTMPCEDPHEW